MGHKRNDRRKGVYAVRGISKRSYSGMFYPWGKTRAILKTMLRKEMNEFE